MCRDETFQHFSAFLRFSSRFFSPISWVTAGEFFRHGWQGQADQTYGQGAGTEGLRKWFAKKRVKEFAKTPRTVGTQRLVAGGWFLVPVPMCLHIVTHV